MAPDYDAVIVGGGIAGSALATVLARAGIGVLVLERQEQYRDVVRGEYFTPWGVAVAQRLGLFDAMVGAGTRASVQRSVVFYDENVSVEQAQAAPFDLSALLPGVPGAFNLGHPENCAALARAAVAAGADVRYGVSAITVEPGEPPSVSFTVDGVEHRVCPRLVVGADGRNSSVRNQLGIDLHGDPAPTLGGGLLVEGLDWPLDSSAHGTCGRMHYFVFPQGDGKTRLYLQYPAEDAQLFNGPDREQAFLDAFVLPCLPEPERFRHLRPVRSFAAYPFRSTWTDTVLADGVALIGDAAGYNDPIIGQGLSLSLSDVADLSDLLFAESTWTPKSLADYARTRTVRMARARASALLASALSAEFGPEPAARRAVALPRMLADEELSMPLAAQLVGYDAFPEYAYSDELRHRILAA